MWQGPRNRHFVTQFCGERLLSFSVKIWVLPGGALAFSGSHFEGGRGVPTLRGRDGGANIWGLDISLSAGSGVEASGRLRPYFHVLVLHAFPCFA